MGLPSFQKFFKSIVPLFGFTGLFVAIPEILVGSEYLDPFTAVDLGVGGDQHYTAADPRYFTNIVASAVGDLDGDGNQDIVLLANAIPHNSSYKGAATPHIIMNHWFKNEWNHGEFLAEGDRLWGVDNGTLGANFNLKDTPQPWFKPAFFASLTEPGIQAKIGVVHFAPPSPNIVMGLVQSTPYVGSDVAWLRGDGRGHFNLMFITPFRPGTTTPEPVRIRMGHKIVLAKLGNDFPGFLDIVLVSAHDVSRTYSQVLNSATSVEPFTGTGRVMWLENRGWNAANDGLNFEDHSIAEYSYDRMPLPFQQDGSAWWYPAAPLNPFDVMVFDIDPDTTTLIRRDDILVANPPLNEGWGAAGNVTYSGNPSTTSLKENYSDTFGIPNEGDKWINAWDGTTVLSLFWYRNAQVGGKTSISTATFQNAWRSDVPFREDTGGMVRLNLGPGKEAVATLNPKIVYRRQLPIDPARPFRLLNRSPNLSKTNQSDSIVAADMNRDGVDELLFAEFDCQDRDGNSTGGCITRFYIFSVEPSGTDDVQVDHKYTILNDGDSYSRHNTPHFTVADVNNDGWNDIIVSNNKTEGDPIKVFFNRSNGNGGYRFVKIRQRSPMIPKNGNAYWEENHFSYFPLNWTFYYAYLSTGDFNRDGFTDIVRTGPSLRATLFINDLNGLQRVRVTTTAVHETGKTKTWTTILGGVLNPTGVSVSTATTGTMGFQSTGIE